MQPAETPGCGHPYRSSTRLSDEGEPGGPGATLATPAGTSTGWSPAVSTTFPPPDPGRRRHGIAELLTLVTTIRRIAYSSTLAPDDAMRRIRDAFAEYDSVA